MKKHLPMILVGIILILTILAFALNSNAETEEPGVPEENAQEEFLLGDINKDGAITAQDAYIVLHLYAVSSAGSGQMPTEEERRLGDANQDNVLDARDATVILTYVTNVAVLPEGQEMTIPEFLAARQ